MMNKMNKMGCMGILFAAALMSSCSSSNDDPTPAPNPNPGTDVVYKWTTDGGLKACICHFIFAFPAKASLPTPLPKKMPSAKLRMAENMSPINVGTNSFDKQTRHVHRAEIQSVSIIFLSVQKYDLFLKFPNKLRKSLSKKEYYS